MIITVFACPASFALPSDALILSTACHAGAAGQNKQHLVTKNTAKLDRETEELHHDRVPLEVGKVIQQGRQEKGLTQKDLATVSKQMYYACINSAQTAGKCAMSGFIKHLRKQSTRVERKSSS